MKSIMLFVFVAGFTMMACNQPATKEDTKMVTLDTTKPVENKIMIPNMFCYSTQNSKDTIFLKVEKFPNVVTGTLTYKIFEKDSNKGTIDGTMHGDTLIADYTFMSEGVSSVRQIAFLIKDNTATEGYAPVEEKNGKVMFKNTSLLSFTKGSKLSLLPCPAE